MVATKPSRPPSGVRPLFHHDHIHVIENDDQRARDGLTDDTRTSRVPRPEYCWRIYDEDPSAATSASRARMVQAH